MKMVIVVYVKLKNSMGRGNMINGIKRSDRFDLIIIEPILEYENFNSYKEVKISKSGMLIGYWNTYRDYICFVNENAIVLRHSNNYIILKINK